MIAHIPTSSESEFSEITFCDHTQRQLDYYINCAQAYLKQKEASTGAEWKKFKKQSGAANFIENCLKMLDKWNKLSQSLQEELKDLPLPAYLPVTSALNLLKVPLDSFSFCLSRLKDILQEGQTRLLPKDISAIAKLFYIKVKRTLTLGEEVTLEDWQLVAKKYKIKSPEKLEALKEAAKELAEGESLLTEQVIQALSDAGYDPLLILPKPKKKYTDGDLDKALSSYQQENDLLKQRIQELELKEVEEFIAQEATEEATKIDDSEVVIPEPVEVVVPEPVEVVIPEPVEVAVPEPVEVVVPEPVIESNQSLSTTESTIKSEIETVKDLKGYKVIINCGGAEKQGTFRVQNGTGHTGQIKTEPDNKVYCLDFKAIQLEYPYNSENYHVLADLIREHDWKVEDRKGSKMGGFRDLLSR